MIINYAISYLREGIKSFIFLRIINYAVSHLAVYKVSILNNYELYRTFLEDEYKKFHLSIIINYATFYLKKVQKVLILNNNK